MRFEQLHPNWQAEQSRSLIIWPVKAVSDVSGYSTDWLYDLRNARVPVSAVTAFYLCGVQREFRFLQDLAEGAGALLHIPPAKRLHTPTIKLLAELTLSFGRFFELSEKVQDGQVLNDEEMREYEQAGEQATTRIWDLVQRARERRKEQTVKKEGK